MALNEHISICLSPLHLFISHLLLTFIFKYKRKVPYISHGFTEHYSFSFITSWSFLKTKEMVSSSVELVFFIIVISSALSVQSWCPQSNPNFKFKQRSTVFWEFEEETKTWVKISLPYNLMSCVNGTCTKVGSIGKTESKDKQSVRGVESDEVLPVRKRVSLNRMSEASVWVTGQSGSIFERFWNGVNWVIAPHELPVFAGYAVSTYIVNQTILALSEDGILYQVKISM